jgi:hypothetical protein
MKPVLLTAKWAGSAKVLAPLAAELQTRGIPIAIYATGSPAEAASFGSLPYTHLTEPISYAQLVLDSSVVVSGLAGTDTPDTHFIRAANTYGIPSIGAVDQNSIYVQRFGTDTRNWPTLIATLDDTCTRTLEAALGGAIAARSRVVGWTAFDHYAALRTQFTAADKERVFASIGVDPAQPWSLYCSQHTPPQADKAHYSAEEKGKVAYELAVAEHLFTTARAHDIPLVVKPHPKELRFAQQQLFPTTEALAAKYGITYVLPSACTTTDLILASLATYGTTSTCITEACLLDRAAAALVPGLPDGALAAFPPLSLGAIPAARTWTSIAPLVQLVSSVDPTTQAALAAQRTRFSVDGGGAKRFADLVESFL